MKNKYIIGGSIIVVFLVLMGYLFTQTNVAYENDFTSVMKSHQMVKATGAWDKAKGFKIDREKNLFSFYLNDNDGVQMKVIYKGMIPNNFQSATTVVVTGKYKNGYFLADDILTKCPSKYDNEYKEETASNT